MIKRIVPSPGRRPTPRGGFTLIELLVVVSIIALLISILLPTLRQAKEVARISACANNQRSIGVGCFSYAIDADGWMPPSETGAPYSPYFMAVDYSGPIRAFYGIGILYHEQRLRGPGSAYCPSQPLPQFMLRTPVNKWWADHPIGSSGTTRSSFFYWTRDDNRYPTLSPTHRKISDPRDGERIIMTEVMTEFDGLAHTLRGGADLNALAIDASVRFWSDRDRWLIDTVHAGLNAVTLPIMVETLFHRLDDER